MEGRGVVVAVAVAAVVVIVEETMSREDNP